MHELSLSRAILETALRHGEGRRVVAIAVTVGALRQVVPGSLRFNFEIVSRGTPCEGALLQFRLLPARLRCECGEQWTLSEPSFRCPRCECPSVEVVSGEELSIDSIEVEEAACTARR